MPTSLSSVKAINGKYIRCCSARSPSGLRRAAPGVGGYVHIDPFNNGVLLIIRQEGKEGTITLEEDDPQVVDAMLHWFYEFDYATSQDPEQALILNLRVYAAAEKYLLPSLKRLAMTKFEQRAEKEWRSDGFAGAIVEAYDRLLDVDDALRQKIARIVNDHRSELFDATKGNEMFKYMAVEIPMFGRDVLMASCGSGNADGWAKYKCPTCGTYWSIQGRVQYLGCPKGCNPHYSSSWWQSYKQA